MKVQPHINTAPRQRFDDLPPAQQAGMLCNDRRFQRFAASECKVPGKALNESATAEYVRNICNITTRSDLNTSQIADRRFQSLRADFDMWLGRLATPR